jgi:tetratricopeptide (TPR) repeat protein
MALRPGLAAAFAIAFATLAGGCGPTGVGEPFVPGATAQAPAPWMIGVVTTGVHSAPLGSSADSGRGDRIDLVLPGGPAEAAGIRSGDVLIALGGQQTPTVRDMVLAVNDSAGKKVEAVLLREGHRIILSVRPDRRPPNLEEEYREAYRAKIKSERRQSRDAVLTGQPEPAFAHGVRALRLQLYACNYDELCDAVAFDRDLERVTADARAMRHPPTVSVEAVRHSRRAIAILRAATTDEDNDRAVAKFYQALCESPWVADAYRDLGLTLARAGRPEAAAIALRRYLLLRPSAPDAEAVEDKIAALDSLAEQRKPWLPFMRNWSMKNGDVERLGLRDTRLAISTVSSVDGFEKPGDVVCAGAVRSRQFKGSCMTRRIDSDEIRCFGPIDRGEAAGAIDKPGVLVIKTLNYRYDPASCRITSMSWGDFRTFTGGTR